MMTNHFTGRGKHLFLFFSFYVISKHRFEYRYRTQCHLYPARWKYYVSAVLGLHPCCCHLADIIVTFWHCIMTQWPDASSILEGQVDEGTWGIREQWSSSLLLQRESLLWRQEFLSKAQDALDSVSCSATDLLWDLWHTILICGYLGFSVCIMKMTQT